MLTPERVAHYICRTALYIRQEFQGVLSIFGDRRWWSKVKPIFVPVNIIVKVYCTLYSKQYTNSTWFFSVLYMFFNLLFHTDMLFNDLSQIIVNVLYVCFVFRQNCLAIKFNDCMWKICYICYFVCFFYEWYLFMLAVKEGLY